MTRDEAAMRANNSIERIRRELRVVLDQLEGDLRLLHGAEAAEMARDRFEAVDETIAEEAAIHGVAVDVLIRGGLQS